MQSNHRRIIGRNTLYAFPLTQTHQSSQKSLDLQSNFTHSDLALSKQKEKIKYLREKVNKGTNHNRIESNNNRKSSLYNTINVHQYDNELYNTNSLLEQKIKQYENEMNDIIRENKYLNNIIKEKNKTIENYERLISEVKEKSEQLIKANDILRSTVDNKVFNHNSNNNNLNFNGSNNTNCYNNKVNYIDQKQRHNTLDNHNYLEEMKYSLSCNKIGSVRLSNANLLNTNKNVHLDNKKLFQEMENLKNQIKDIQTKFSERKEERNKKMEQLSKERVELITEIDHIPIDKERHVNILYTQNDNECNEIQALKKLLNDMN